jgi:hypothetical protein
MCQWDFAIGKCSFIDDKINHEVKWDGGFRWAKIALPRTR